MPGSLAGYGARSRCRSRFPSASYPALAKGGCLSQKDLARLARVEQPTMAEMLARMERDGALPPLSGCASEGGRRAVGGQERGRVSRERLRVLEQRAMSRVGVRQKDRVRQVLAEPVGVRDGDHLVADTVHDQRRVTDGPELGEPLALELFPLAEGSYSSAPDLGARDGRSRSVLAL